MWYGRPERKNRGGDAPSPFAELTNIFALTVVVKHRATVFADDRLARAATLRLRDIETRQRTTLHAYCVMPDHVHIVVERTQACDVEEFVTRFKNNTLSEARALGIVGSFWLRSFWRRRVRDQRHLMAEVHYALDNPVRAGLVKLWHEYPHSASPHVPRPL